MSKDQKNQKRQNSSQNQHEQSQGHNPDEKCAKCPKRNECFGYVVYFKPAACTALLHNDVERLEKVFKSMNFAGPYEYDVCKPNVSIATSLLRIAAVDVAFARGNVTEETAMKLMQLTAPICDIFEFCLYLIMAQQPDRLAKLPSPPEKLIQIAAKEQESEDFRKQLFALGEDDYLAFLYHLVDKVDELHTNFANPIIEYAYLHQLMTLSSILTWICESIEKIRTNHENKEPSDILSKQSFLMEFMFSDDDPDDDEEDKKEEKEEKEEKDT